MQTFFRSYGTYIINNQYQDYVVGLLFLDSEIDKLKEEGRWDNQLKLKELLLEKASPVVLGFADKVKVLVAMDFNFLIHQIEIDPGFLKEQTDQENPTLLYNTIMQAVNMATKTIIQSVNANLKGHDISLKDYIERISLNHENKELWISRKSVDEHGNKVEFYSPYAKGGVSSLITLENYN
jgi:DNA-binding protein YbaB